MLDSIVFPTFILPYIIGISPDFFAAKNQRNTPLADSPFSPSNFQSMSCPLCKVIFQRWSPQSVSHILVKNQKSCYNIKACACGEIGRRTRLRIWRFIHGGSSPFTRTISVQSFSAIKQQRFFYYLLTRLIICIGNPLILCLRLFNIVLIV